MARVKINIPKLKIFETSILASISDINYGGHVGNDRFLSYCHEVRLRYLKSIEQSELDFYGKSIIMSDAVLSYKGELFHGDEITVELFVDDFSEYGLDFIYRICCVDKEVCRAKTGIVFYDYKMRKISKSPNGIKEKILGISSD